MESGAWQGDWPITQPYGPTTLSVEPWYHGQHWHCGDDIGMPIGTKLYAIRAGRVTRRTLGILGITSAFGQTDYYIHGTYSVLLQANVAQGAEIGVSGAIVPGGGYLTGPHLHFEIQPQGGLLNVPPALDPNPVLFPRQSAGSGSQEGDMTPEQEAKLDKLLASTAIRNPVTLDALQARLDQAVGDLKAAIKAAPGGGGDNTAVLAAIAQVQLVVDKIDRGE